MKTFLLSILALSALVLPTAADYPQSVINAGPVAYWRFEAVNESSVVGGHSTEFQGDATITAAGGGAPLTGVIGNRALSLDGNGDSVVTGLDTEATFADAGTISAWVKFARTPGAAGHAMSVGGRFQNANDFNINIYDDNGNAGIAWQTRTNTTGVAYYVPPTIVGWHHLVTTIDDVAGFVRIYWDGELKNSVPSADHQPNTLPFIIGNDVAFGPRYFEGLIDELAVFERALSDAEIAALHQSAQSLQPGDMNNDGQINAFDIELFVLALLDPNAYFQQTGIDPVAVADLNGDGVANAFDIEPFLQLLLGGEPAIAQLIADFDSDGDSEGDLAEVVSGTDPHDGRDLLKITEVRSEDSQLFIEWSSVVGRRYLVEFSESGQSGTWRTLSNSPIDGNGNTLAYSSAHPNFKTGFFRVRVTARE